MNIEQSIAANKKARETGELGRWCVFRDDMGRLNMATQVDCDEEINHDGIRSNGTTYANCFVRPEDCDGYASDQEIKQFYETLEGE